MKVAKVTIDSDCDVKALVEKSERRVFYAIQIFAIGIILFFLFLYRKSMQLCIDRTFYCNYVILQSLRAFYVKSACKNTLFYRNLYFFVTNFPTKSSL